MASPSQHLLNLSWLPLLMLIGLDARMTENPLIDTIFSLVKIWYVGALRNNRPSHDLVPKHNTRPQLMALVNFYRFNPFSLSQAFFSLGHLLCIVIIWGRHNFLSIQSCTLASNMLIWTTILTMIAFKPRLCRCHFCPVKTNQPTFLQNPSPFIDLAHLDRVSQCYHHCLACRDLSTIPASQHINTPWTAHQNKNSLEFPFLICVTISLDLQLLI